MLRRWIPITGMLAVAVLLLTADIASAQLFQRLRGRRGNDNYYPSQPVATTSYAAPAAAQPAAAEAQPGQPVVAQQATTRYVYEQYGRFGRGRWVAVTQPAGTAMTNQTTRQAFYPSDGTQVQVNIRVPAIAELTIDGQRTTLTGTNRVFISPALERGYQYSYELQAKWMENGKEVTRTRKVSFQPGQQVSVDFMTPTAEERNQ